MDRDQMRRILEVLKERAPDGKQIHPTYGWGGFIDVFEEIKEKKTK
jgi:glycine/D-amino acid oxidase-like deaminating enzyme